MSIHRNAFVPNGASGIEAWIYSKAAINGDALNRILTCIWLPFFKNCPRFLPVFTENERSKQDIKTPEHLAFLRFSGVFYLVAGEGLEPTTSGLWARRATNCSIPRYMLSFRVLWYYTTTVSELQVFFLIFFNFFENDEFDGGKIRNSMRKKGRVNIWTTGGLG